MIFESWSLFIDHAERHFIGRKHNVQEKNEYMRKHSKELYEQISRYLPNGESHLGIVETFMWIYNKVVATWERRVFRIFPKSNFLRFKQSNTERFVSFNIGFRPYRLMDCSGARITEVNEDDRKQAYITDPELSYLKIKMKNENPVAVSITEAIDQLFEKICNTIADVIGSFIGIKFFLRRTLGGCEFGVCVDFDLESDDEAFIRENCIVDRDPLLVFTISVKSMAPILAGVLIFALVFLASMSTTIMAYVSAFPVTLPAGVVKKTVKLLLEQIAISLLSKQLEDFCQKIIDFLYSKLQKQIKLIKVYNEKMGINLEILAQIIDTKDFEKSGEKLNELFHKRVRIKVNSRFTRSFISEGLPTAHMFKIGLLLVLSLTAFIIGFHNQKKAIAESKEEKNAAAFDKDPKNEQNLDKLQNANKKAYTETDQIEPPTEEQIELFKQKKKEKEEQ